MLRASMSLQNLSLCCVFTPLPCLFHKGEQERGLTPDLRHLVSYEGSRERLGGLVSDSGERPGLSRAKGQRSQEVGSTGSQRYFHTGKKAGEVPVSHGSQTGPTLKETLLKRFTRESPVGWEAQCQGCEYVLLSGQPHPTSQGWSLGLPGGGGA